VPGRGFFQVELVDEPVVLLPGQVPQQNFPVESFVVVPRQVNPPYIHALRRIGFDVAILDQTVSQGSLARATLAHEHDLCIHIAAGWLSSSR
jgi:hypothetical protein